MHVTIEETDEGTLICLLLQPSEISDELRSFASLPRGPRAQGPSGTSTSRPTGSRPAAPVPLANLDVGGARSPQGPSKDTIVEALEASLKGKGPVLGSLIGRASRAIANVLPFFEGETVSEALAIRTGESVPEVHARLSLPFLRLPRVGRDLTKALTTEFRAEAARGRIEVLDRTGRIYEAALEKIQTVPDRPGVIKAKARDVITERRVKELLTNLRTARILAGRIREEQ